MYSLIRHPQTPKGLSFRQSKAAPITIGSKEAGGSLPLVLSIDDFFAERQNLGCVLFLPGIQNLLVDGICGRDPKNWTLVIVWPLQRQCIIKNVGVSVGNPSEQRPNIQNFA